MKVYKEVSVTDVFAFHNVYNVAKNNSQIVLAIEDNGRVIKQKDLNVNRTHSLLIIYGILASVH